MPSSTVGTSHLASVVVRPFTNQVGADADNFIQTNRFLIGTPLRERLSAHAAASTLVVCVKLSCTLSGHNAPRLVQNNEVVTIAALVDDKNFTRVLQDDWNGITHFNPSAAENQENRHVTPVNFRARLSANTCRHWSFERDGYVPPAFPDRRGGSRSGE